MRILPANWLMELGLDGTRPFDMRTAQLCNPYTGRARAERALCF